jgi:hypothetical protein
MREYKARMELKKAIDSLVRDDVVPDSNPITTETKFTKKKIT